MIRRALVAGACFVVTASFCGSATITWQPIEDATGDASELITTGNFVDSATTYGGNDITVRGVTFNRRTSGGSSFGFANNSNITFSNVSTAYQDRFGSPPGSGWDTDYTELLKGGCFTKTGTITIEIGGLTQGNPYRVQLWTAWRNEAWPTEFKDLSNNSSGNLVNGTSGSSPPECVVGTFTADSSTQTIIADRGSTYTVFTALQVRTPEPACGTLIVFGVAIFGLGTGRRAT